MGNFLTPQILSGATLFSVIAYLIYEAKQKKQFR
jgi:hypothetical protein